MYKSKQAQGEYYVVGVMSGSSLDGVDVCLTKFNQLAEQKWSFEMIQTQTLELPQPLSNQLLSADQLQALDLLILDHQYGQWLGEEIKKWIETLSTKPSLIGVHGHTVFHQPASGVSLQIGSGLKISTTTGLPVVDRFRDKDVALGGQGAPLVPFGEGMLFSEYQAFINFGGIANISIHQDSVRAWDIAPCNQVFNFLSRKVGKNYDSEGQLAKTGTVDDSWLHYLGTLEYFHQPPPKSLSNQWTEHVLKNAPSKPENALATYVEFLSTEIANTLNNEAKPMKLLLSGGGAKNTVLIDSIQQKVASHHHLELPSSDIIEYKEALIFAFLALFRHLQLPNVLASATGATRDSVSGILHLPK